MVMVVMCPDLKECESEYPFSLLSYSLLRFVKPWTAVRVTMFGTTQMKRFLTIVVGTFYASTFLFLTY